MQYPALGNYNYNGMQGFNAVKSGGGIGGKLKGALVGLAGGTVVGMLAVNFEEDIPNKLLKKAAAPAAASLSALILYGLIS